MNFDEGLIEISAKLSFIASIAFEIGEAELILRHAFKKAF